MIGGQGACARCSGGLAADRRRCRHSALSLNLHATGGYSHSSRRCAGPRSTVAMATASPSCTQTSAMRSMCCCGRRPVGRRPPCAAATCRTRQTLRGEGPWPPRQPNPAGSTGRAATGLGQRARAYCANTLQLRRGTALLAMHHCLASRDTCRALQAGQRLPETPCGAATAERGRCGTSGHALTWRACAPGWPATCTGSGTRARRLSCQRCPIPSTIR